MGCHAASFLNCICYFLIVITLYNINFPSHQDLRLAAGAIWGLFEKTLYEWHQKHFSSLRLQINSKLNLLQFLKHQLVAGAGCNKRDSLTMQGRKETEESSQNVEDFHVVTLRGPPDGGNRTCLSLSICDNHWQFLVLGTLTAWPQCW